MNNETLNFVFRNNGRFPPYGEPDQEIRRLWEACNCPTCETPCIHKGKPERFPEEVVFDGLDGHSKGRGLCARLIREKGEPFTWVNPYTKEIACIPRSVLKDMIDSEFKA